MPNDTDYTQADLHGLAAYDQHSLPVALESATIKALQAQIDDLKIQIASQQVTIDRQASIMKDIRMLIDRGVL